MTVIKVIQQREDAEITRLAREVIRTGVETGDEDVLNRVILLAKQEDLDVVFEVEGTDRRYDPEMMFRLRFDRNLTVRKGPNSDYSV